MRVWTPRDAPLPDEADDPIDEELESAAEAWRDVRQRRRAWVPLFIVSAGLAALLYAMQLGNVTTSGYDLQRLEAERNEWRQRNEQLELELAKVQSLAWIEVEAVRRLGMQKAERVTYLEVPPIARILWEPAHEPAPELGPRAPALEPESVLADVLRLWRGLLVHLVPPIDSGP